MYTCAVWTFDHVGVLTGSYSYVVGKHCIMSYVGVEESVSAIAWTLLLKWLAMWCVDVARPSSKVNCVKKNVVEL